MSETHAQTTPFVRDTMLPPEPPPATQSGAILWLRRNLFSGPLNVALTVLGLAMLWGVVAVVWPWLSHAVWNASSISECRQIVAERHGQGATGACFAVIRERWNQFLFGFYPRAEYWRPTLAFGLLFFALGPVLFSESRLLRQIVAGVAAVATFVCCMLLGAGNTALALIALTMLVWAGVNETSRNWSLGLTLLYPFLGVWLLWGGSLWNEIGVLAGFGAGFAAWRLAARVGVTGMIGFAVAVLGTVLWWWLLAAPFAAMMQSLLAVSLPPVASTRFGGFVLSITIGVAAITMSLPLGIILALARRSDMPVVRMMAVMFIEFIRGVPLITLLFVASLLLNYFLPPGTSFDIILRVIIMVTLFASAYMAEVIRGGLAALPRGQYEAAGALGLDYWKAQRLIVLPQALKISIPGIVSTFIGLFKDTTLVTFVGLFDPLKAMADTVRASFEWKGAYWEPYVFTGTIFFVLCFSMSRYSMYLERRLKRDHR